jgi:DNA-binding beta-propeller fold protein YncE
LYKWGVQGRGEGEFDRPAGLAFDADDHLLVVDGVNNRIQRYTKDGRFLSQWGRAGRDRGEFNVPWGIAIGPDQNVYVADWRNDRVQQFDPGGKYLASLGTPGRGEGEFCRPAGVAVDSQGLIYVADWGNERVQVLTPDGQFLTQLRGEADLSSWAKDYFISNQDELRERQRANLEPPLTLRPTDGLREISASIEKLFWGPTAVKVDSQGRLYVVDSCRHRLQIYQKSAA